MMHCIIGGDAPTGPQKFVHLAVLAAVPVTGQDRTDQVVSVNQPKRRRMSKEGIEWAGPPGKIGNGSDGVTRLWSLRYILARMLAQNLATATLIPCS
jgi:hypothetical protein